MLAWVSALVTKPHKEQLIWHQIQGLGLDTFYPHLRVNPVNPRARKVKPYFPGYVLVSADLDVTGLNTFQYMPHAIGVVCFGGEPGVIPNAVVEGLKRHIAELRSSDADPASKFQRGDQVRIHEGPLEGFQAIFDYRLSGKQRVKVLLEMIGGRHFPVELSSSNIVSAVNRTIA
jgi:transcriptional antiterminator RfaH